MIKFYRKLSVAELMEAISHDPTVRPYTRLSEMKQDRHTISAGWIRKKLGTLLDVRRELYVSFNHYSAKEYLHQEGKQLLRGCDFLCDQGPSYYLARSCLHYLAAEDLNEVFVGLSWRAVPLVQKKRRAGIPYATWVDDGNDSKDGCAMLSERFPFLNYSSRNWYNHIETRHQAGLLLGKIYPLLHRKKLYLPSTDWGHWRSLCLLHYPRDRDRHPMKDNPLPVGHNPGIRRLMSLVFTREPDWSNYSDKQIIDALVPRPPTLLTNSGRYQIDSHIIESSTDIKICQENLEAAALIRMDPVLGGLERLQRQDSSISVAVRGGFQEDR